MKLSLGPILFFWQKETLLDFYTGMLDAPLDAAIGERIAKLRGASTDYLRAALG